MDYQSHMAQIKQAGICPFCEEMDAFSLDHNEYAFVLPARAPYQKGHLLVCPKRHGELLSDYDEIELQAIYSLITKWQTILYKHYGELVIFIRQWAVWGTTGKSVAHLHRHIVPNFTIRFGDSQSDSDARKFYTDEEYRALIHQLKQIHW